MSIHAYLRITMYNMHCSSTRSHKSHKVMSLLEKFVSVLFIMIYLKLMPLMAPS